ncbi:cation transporter [Flammeovirga sp. MY04]|uniref:cation transporter n=1 Tax=Flammeovirga sp. MY04 TaxID=1191459 RepID=UPI0008061DED|nr:cation transporter [Flammeovirga sp. MY04]ANQ52292.1 cation transporter [Flammeovirga sp. MY04]
MNHFQKIEITTLRIGAFINLLMAIGGWITFDITGSEAMLLDGNFSFIAVLVTIAAEFISRAKHQKTATFPFGKYSYEAFFVLFKGFLILGVILSASFQNSLKIINYFQGEDIPLVKTGPIVYYIIAMVILCFGMAYYANAKNKSMNNQSDILRVEVASLKLDGFLSLFSGVALVSFSFINENSFFGFLRYTGDSIVVLVMCLMMIKSPFDIIKDAFVELGGGVLQDKELRIEIEEKVSSLVCKEFDNTEIFISKMGSSFLVLVYVNVDAGTIKVDRFRALKEEVYQALSDTIDSLTVEFVLE